MSDQITTAMVKQYSDNVQILAQQKGSRLAGCVRMEPGVVGKQAFFDQIGATTARKRTTRHSDTPLINTPHTRRRVAMVDYDWADLLDKHDKPKLLTDPTSKYAVNAGYAFGRSKDDEIISAALGTAYTGEEGSTAVSFDSNMVVAVGSANLTVAKVLAAKALLDANDIDPDIQRYIACGSSQVQSMLNQTEVKSADYNTVKALAEGKIDTFCGFKFIQTQRLATDTSSYRRVLAWAETGLLLAVGMEVETDIGPRRDKNMATQVYVGMSIGATRMSEKEVVEIKCSEA